MDFSFLIPQNITVKRGGFADIGKICAKYSDNVMVFRYGEAFFNSGVADALKKSMDEAGVKFRIYDHIKGEPSPDVINKAAKAIREHGCTAGLAIGGGSPIDAAKAALALAPNGSDIMDYIEGFNPKPFENEPLPLIAVPTTAGTGSECTKNAVITEKGKFKNSVRADAMLPKYALLDANLMTAVDKKTTATAGADCLCQLIEGYVSKFAEPFTDALTLYFSKIAYDNLPVAYENGGDLDARESMAIAACASGMAMANGGLGAAHGIAAGLGALTPLPHGLICGVALPYVMEFNIESGVWKYCDIAERITGKIYASKEEGAKEAVDLVRELNQKIGLPENFETYHFDKSMIPKIAEASMGSSMSKNPVPVTFEQCADIIKKLL